MIAKLFDSGNRFRLNYSDNLYEMERFLKKILEMEPHLRVGAKR